MLGQILENAENESMNLETPKKLKLTTPKKVKSATPTRSNTPRKITPRNASKTPGFVKPMSIRNALSKESGIKPLQNLEPKDILMEESSTTTMEETCAKNSILPVLENTQSSITNGADNLEQSDFVPTVQYRRRVPLYVGGQIFRITVHLDSTKAVLEKSINLVTKQSGLELEWGSGNVKYGWSELNDQLINKLDSILVQ